MTQMSEHTAESDAGPFSVREIERALREADVPADEMATDDDLLRYAGRAEAVEIVRDMLGLTRVTPPAGGGA